LPLIFDTLIVYRKYDKNSEKIFEIQLEILDQYSSTTIFKSVIKAFNEKAHRGFNNRYADNYLELMFNMFAYIPKIFIYKEENLTIALKLISKIWASSPSLCQKVDNVLQILQYILDNKYYIEECGNKDIDTDNLFKLISSGKIDSVVKFGDWSRLADLNYEYLINKLSIDKSASSIDQTLRFTESPIEIPKSESSNKIPKIKVTKEKTPENKISEN